MKLPVSQEVKAVQTKAEAVVAQAKKVTVDSPESFTAAGEVLKQVVTAKKTIKAEKEKFTKPARDIIAQAKEMFGDLEKAAVEAEKIIKGAMLAYQTAVDEENRVKAERLERRVEKGTMKLDTAIRKAGEMPTTNTAEAGVTKTVTKKVRITNPELVPSQYWFLDESLVRRDALGNKAQGIEPIEIPGVEVYEESSLSMR